MGSIVGNLIQIPCIVHHVDRDGATDDYGNPTVTSTPSDERCYFAQQTRGEPGSDLLINPEAERWVIYLEGDVTLDATDRVEVFGEIYEVIGPPWPVRDPLFPDRVDHLEASLERRR